VKYKVGDRVAWKNHPGEIYTVTCVDECMEFYNIGGCTYSKFVEVFICLAEQEDQEDEEII
jgi:hypothetical protein